MRMKVLLQAVVESLPMYIDRELVMLAGRRQVSVAEGDISRDRIDACSQIVDALRQPFSSQRAWTWLSRCGAQNFEPDDLGLQLNVAQHIRIAGHQSFGFSGRKHDLVNVLNDANRDRPA